MPSSSPLHPGASVPSRPLAVGPALAKVSFEFPDLSAWPTPVEKMRILLEKAAEVEHALMIQYLYAAYSLKPTTGPSGVTDPLQVADLNAWRPTILEIAKEEMGHLMTVQNLRLLVGLEPSFEREDLPLVSGLFPFGSSLRPLDQETLAAYVFAESPTDPQGIDDVINALGMGPNKMAVDHVGVLYGLVGVVLATDLTEIQHDAAGGDFWYEMVLQLAEIAYQQDPDPKAWHLEAGDFQVGSAARQGVQGDWTGPHSQIRIDSPKSRADAKAAIQFIGLQGEGPGESTTTPSHFLRFLQVFRVQPGKTRAFPDANGWLPTLDVPTDPKVSDDASLPGAISNPTTQPWAKLANLRYAILLGLLEEYLSQDPATDPTIPRFLPRTALQEMTSNVSRISAKLVTLPRAPTGAGVAALPFELPTTGFPLPAGRVARHKVIADRLKEAIALATAILKSEGGTDPLLTSMLATDQKTLPHFS